MLNHQGQGPNQIESPGNLLQQQPPNFDVQVSRFILIKFSDL